MLLIRASLGRSNYTRKEENVFPTFVYSFSFVILVVVHNFRISCLSIFLVIFLDIYAV